jgi:hypothetical protein
MNVFVIRNIYSISKPLCRVETSKTVDNGAKKQLIMDNG